MSPRRMGALILRHVLLWRRHPATLTDLFYWPLIDLLFFGFLSLYLGRQAGVPKIAGLLLGAMILWDFFFRVQQGISVSFLTELWTSNLINLFVAPLSVREFLGAMMVFGLVKIAVTASFMTLVAWVLYHFNLFTLGFALIPFIVTLILFGWAIGTVITAIIMRFGLGAEGLAWSLGFLFQPFGAVFWPMSVYPVWLQKILAWLPLPHIFEGMRSVVLRGTFDARHAWWALGLDAVALAGALAFFAWMFRAVLRQGSLLKALD